MEASALDGVLSVVRELEEKAPEEFDELWVQDALEGLRDTINELQQ